MLGSFTTPADPAADEVIAGHMAQIRQAILSSGGKDVGCIALTGGFGRGEGGVVHHAQGRYLPVNDYDIMVVARSNSPWAWWRLRRRVKALEPALSRSVGVRVDIACKTPAMLRHAPPTVEAYEMAVGYKLLWGSDAPLQAIPWRNADVLPAAEASRYLFNRGAALLWARQMLEKSSDLPARDEAGWQFVLIAIQKAWLSWGDALLLLHGRYTARYSERRQRFHDIPLPPELQFVGEPYAEALRFKLQPDFEPYHQVDLPALLKETIERHERMWRWVETKRGTSQGEGKAFWLAYFTAPGPRLRAGAQSPSLGRRLYNLGLNLWRVRSLSFTWIWEHPEERLARVLPLLLFMEDDPDMPWAHMAVLLGLKRRGPSPMRRSVLCARLIQLWHPGRPFY